MINFRTLLLWLGVGACATVAHGEPVRIDFWHSMSAAKGKLVDQLVEQFNALPENQGRVKLVPTFIGSYEDGINKLRTAMVGKRGPHLAQAYEIGTQVMIDSRAIVPLQDFIDKDPTFPKTSLLPQILRYYSVDDRLYALPFATSNPILYYNQDMFERAGVAAPPQTFQQLKDLCSSKLVDPANRVTAITWPLVAWFFEQFMAKQGQVYAEPSNGRGERAHTLAYASPAGVTFVTLWRDLVKSGCFANAGRGWDPAEQNFLAGRSAMFVTSTSDVMEVQAKAKFRVGTAPIFGPDTPTVGGTVIGGNGVWVMKGHPENEQQLAYEFLRFMTRPETQRFWHTGTGYFPIRQDVIDTLKAEGFYERKPAAWTAIQQLIAVPDIPATQGAVMGVFPEAREHVESAIEQVLSGRLEPEAALKLAAERTRKSLARYNSMIERIEAAAKK